MQDTHTPSQSVASVLAQLGSAAMPLLIDVRRAPTFEAASTLAAGATWRDPGQLDEWARYLPRHRPIVIYCVHGFEISRNTAEMLAASGLNAAWMEGGLEAWEAASGPVIKKPVGLAIPSLTNQPSVWVTRERPKIDRIACPWLIRRFIDPLAEFVYAPPQAVLATAASRGAIAYDVPGVQFTHRGERCSFDALIEDFALADPALARVATVVRGADTDRLDLAPESAGLLAISLGLGATQADDHVLLRHGMVVYDALYAWARQAVAGTAERHTWKAPS